MASLLLISHSLSHALLYMFQKTWGASQKITCELDECSTHVEFAVRSGIVPYECIHLKSLLCCPRLDTTPIILDEAVLTEMVTCRVFGDARKQSCLNQQKAATDAGVPLSVEVTVGGPCSISRTESDKSRFDQSMVET